MLIFGALFFLDQFLSIIVPASLHPAVLVTLLFVMMWSYDVFFDMKWEGRTPGKRTVGIRVVDQRGLPLSLPQSFVRNIVRAFDALPLMYGVGALIALLDPHGRRLGDIVAGTLVISDGTPLEYKGTAGARSGNSIRCAKAACCA